MSKRKTKDKVRGLLTEGNGQPKKGKGFNEEKQEEFIHSLLANGFNISQACREVGIAQPTYYYALNYKDGFKEKVTLIKSLVRNVVFMGMLEGITSKDLNIRKEYLKLLPSDIIASVLGLNDKNTKLSEMFDKDNITIV